MPSYKYIIPEYLSGERLDKALSSLCEESSRSQIQKAIKNGHLVLNDKIISNLSSKVKENDAVEINIEEEIPEHIEPTNIPLDIVYEDEDLIVINKNSNMTVHPGAGNHNDTLVNALLYYSKNLSDVGGEIRPGIVHRLDKTTSGLMVVAKNNQAHVHLAEQIESRNLVRRYKALAWGMLKQTEGTIDIPIGRSTSDRKKMNTLKNGGGKSAITHYKVLEIIRGGLFSLVECKLETGRTHQIRVHMSHIAHSIVGDQTYGNNARKIHGCPDHLKENLRKMGHQALHSFYMSFDHPKTGEKMEFEQDIPEDYQALLSFIRTV
jgi:23S rRNA pseudouridine1911/1915/1917 synthase